VGLTGTTWTYSDDDGQGDEPYDIVFLPGEKTRSTNPADVTPDNDTWSQRGATVEFAFNDGYARYTGAFKNSNTITGRAVNEVGNEWNWKLVRKKR